MGSAKAEDIDKLRKLFTGKPDLAPNFGSTSAVTVPHPIDVVFDKRGRGETLEASVRLSDLCQNFELLESDRVKPDPPSTSDASGASSIGIVDLLASTCRNTPSSAPSLAGSYPRQFFLLEEDITMLFGAYTHTTKIFGSLTTDEKGYTALYESVADAGVYVHKTRRFVKVGENETRVEEEIKGQCSRWLQIIVDKETKRSHK